MVGSKEPFSICRHDGNSAASFSPYWLPALGGNLADSVIFFSRQLGLGFLVAIFGLSVRKSPTERKSMLNNQPNHLVVDSVLIQYACSCRTCLSWRSYCRICICDRVSAVTPYGAVAYVIFVRTCWLGVFGSDPESRRIQILSRIKITLGNCLASRLNSDWQDDVYFLKKSYK